MSYRIVRLMLLLCLILGLTGFVFANKNEDAAEKYCDEVRKAGTGTECKVSAWIGCGTWLGER